MERIKLTAEQQDAVDAWVASKAEDTLNPMDPVVHGTNLVPFDHLEIDHSWQCVVLGSGNGVVYVYVPEWNWFSEGGALAPIALVTDRAGPNGQTLPIVGPPLLP